MEFTTRSRALRCLLLVMGVLVLPACGNDEGEHDGSVVTHDLSVPTTTDGAVTIPDGGVATGEALTAVPLVSDLTNVGAAHVDPMLMNAWGLAFGPTGTAWVASNGAGVVQLYDQAGVSVTALPSVTVPAPSGATGPSAPTGIVSNQFQTALDGDQFVIATEDGTIAGWQTSDGATAVLRVDNSAGDNHAIYKGVAIANPGSGIRVYATDFHNNKIDVFGSNYQAVTVSGAFTDPNLPAGFAPFNIALINGKLYVSYAKQDAEKKDDVKGVGNGFIDSYDLMGASLTRIVSGGALNSPWGMVIAPADFGTASNMLLVGNFGDGMINVYQPTTGSLVAHVNNTAGASLVIDGLWALQFAPNTSQLFFTAGPNDEANGIFGRLDR